MSSTENSPRNISPAKVQSENNSNNNSEKNTGGFHQCHAHMLEKIMMKLENQSKEQELYMSELRKERVEKGKRPMTNKKVYADGICFFQHSLYFSWRTWSNKTPFKID